MMPAAVRQKPTKTIWVTATGERIRVRDMEDRHLLNTINMLKRYAILNYFEAISAGYFCLGFMRGEMAILSVEQDLRALEEDTHPEDLLEEEFPIFATMLAEAKRRKLKVKK